MNNQRKIIRKMLSRSGRSRVRVLALLLIVASVAYVGYKAFAAWQRQKSLPAVRAVERATKARNKLHSWHIRYKFSSNQPDGSVTTQRFEYWYQRPDRYKMQQGKMGTISNGNSQIFYSTSDKLAVHYPFNKDTKSDSFDPLNWADDSITANARLVGVGSVIGRRCDIIKDADSSYRSLTYIDQQTGVPLKNVMTLRDKSIFETIAIEMEVDIPLARETFSPPAGMRVVKTAFPFLHMLVWLSDDPMASMVRTPHYRGGNPAYVDIALRKVREEDKELGRRSELTELHWPEYVPSHYKVAGLEPVPHRVQEGDSYSHSDQDYSKFRIVYLSSNTDNTIIFDQSKDAPKQVAGRKIRIGNTKGRIETRTRPFPHSILQWPANGLWFTLAATNLPEDELLKIAGSLQSIR